MITTLFTDPLFFFLSLFSLIVAITIHEFAHAKAADHLGDPTPRLQGRVTLNPIAHIDLYGLIFLLLVGFGWGRPVQFDPFNLKHPRRDAAIISFAGPLSNIILASVLSILISLFIFIDNPILIIIGTLVFSPMILMNLMLAVFNMLPIHPLDGFKIVGGLLSEEQAREWYQLERYGMNFLLLLIIPFNGSSMLSTILGPILNFLAGIFLQSRVPFTF
jgi:Zn-dependent protease